ncbi:MAG: transposase [Micrococcaceae bacterium]|nr:transposase [Micrococcaceae bacterium]
MVQQCIVHLIRNSFRYAGHQHRDGIVKALKPVYTAPGEAAAKDRFQEFTAEWGQRYPAIVKLWESAWASVRAVARIRRGDPTGDLHDERDRVNQRPLPPGRQSPRPLSERGCGPEMSLPRHQVS